MIPHPTYVGAVRPRSLGYTFVFRAFDLLRMSKTGLTARIWGGIAIPCSGGLLHAFRPRYCAG